MNRAELQSTARRALFFGILVVVGIIGATILVTTREPGFIMSGSYVDDIVLYIFILFCVIGSPFFIGGIYSITRHSH